MSGHAAPTLPPQIELLSCAARPSIDPDPVGASRLRQLAGAITDWDAVRMAATRHCVAPLLSMHLEAHCSGDVPPAALSALRRDFHDSAERGLQLAADLLEVLDAFRAAGLQIIPYKGPVLAAQAYGRLALRQFLDLDIILRQRDLPRAYSPLVALGYVPELPFEIAASARHLPGQYLFNREASGTILELHTERTLRYFPEPLDLDALAARLAPVSVAGHSVLTFAPADALPILCVHGSKHFWERLGWIADIAALASAAEVDWEQTFQLARQLSAERMLRLGLYLAAELLKAPLPEPVLRRVREDAGVAQLAAQVCERLISADFSPPGVARRLWFRVHMRGNAWQGLAYSLRLATAPTEEDWAQARLAGPLAPFYSVLRPFRLLRKYGVGLSRPGPQPRV
ncbi:MAG TPA: nucleotidyltransferase family protein [Candidatus Acidoferrales bacterium]|nr:nucleotidyltransferase family protein [Candidatus Acidoferrales bacterium]